MSADAARRYLCLWDTLGKVPTYCSTETLKTYDLCYLLDEPCLAQRLHLIMLCTTEVIMVHISGYILAAVVTNPALRVFDSLRYSGLPKSP